MTTRFRQGMPRFRRESGVGRAQVAPTRSASRADRWFCRSRSIRSVHTGIFWAVRNCLPVPQAAIGTGAGQADASSSKLLFGRSLRASRWHRHQAPRRRPHGRGAWAVPCPVEHRSGVQSGPRHAVCQGVASQSVRQPWRSCLQLRFPEALRADVDCYRSRPKLPDRWY